MARIARQTVVAATERSVAGSGWRLQMRMVEGR